MIWCALEIFFVTLFFYYHNYLFLFIVLCLMYLTYKRNTRSILFITQFLLLVFSLLRFNYFHVPEAVLDTENYVVLEKHSNYVILEKENIKYLCYENNLEIGNQVLIDGSVEKLDLDNDFYRYLKTQKIEYLLDGEVIYNDEKISFSNKL